MTRAAHAFIGVRDSSDGYGGVMRGRQKIPPPISGGGASACGTATGDQMVDGLHKRGAALTVNNYIVTIIEQN